MVFTELVIRNAFLLFAVSRCADDFIHPPFVAGCSREHAAHQVPAAVRMRKCMKRIAGIHPEFYA